MIILLSASAIYLTALQAGINGPRDAFQSCLKQSAEKASAQKVDGNGYEAFVRTSCGGQLNSFKSAVVGFDMKNKMSKKDAGDDADAMIADFVSSSANHYRYVLKSEPITAAVKPSATPTAPAVDAAVKK
jgi:hypothetical protein